VTDRRHVAACAGSAEDSAGAPHGSSDSSSDSDYDQQLAQKMKQRGSFTGQASDPDSFLSASAAVMMTSAAASRPQAMLARQSSTVTDADNKDSVAKLVRFLGVHLAQTCLALSCVLCLLMILLEAHASCLSFYP
jgi:hypothetical protein